MELLTISTVENQNLCGKCIKPTQKIIVHVVNVDQSSNQNLFDLNAIIKCDLETKSSMVIIFK